MRVLWLVAAGCSAGAPSDPIPPVTAPPQTTVPATLELNGSRPEQNLAAPVFSSVVNRDGTPRAQADLIGHPTVLWFYPAANTGG